MALGAQTKDVLGLVLSEGFRMVLLGVFIGVAGGVALSRYLSSLFFGVQPGGVPPPMSKVALLMLGIALVRLPPPRLARDSELTRWWRYAMSDLMTCSLRHAGLHHNWADSSLTS